MKKLITLFAAAGLVFAASAPASAVDIKLDGAFEMQHTQYGSFGQGGITGSTAQAKGGYKGDRTHQRIRLGITAAVSESLSGYFQIESKWDWGANRYESETGIQNSAAMAGDSRVSVRMWLGYIDWLIPNTPVKVRMGRHQTSLPAFANGKNGIFTTKDPSDGITLVAPVTDWLSLTAFWLRLDRSNSAGNYGQSLETAKANNLDMFGLYGNFKFNGFKFSPFVAYAAIGKYKGDQWSNNNGTNLGKGSAFWVGTNFNLSMFDPFKLDLAFAYGDRKFDTNSTLDAGYANYGTGKGSQHGWFVDLKLAYKTPYVTPTLLWWWGSGDKENADYAYQGTMPAIGGRFKGSYGFFNGATVLDNEYANNHTGNGTWGLRLAAENISFIKDLTHEFALVYAQGTHDKNNMFYFNSLSPARYMTTKDKIFEIDFGTSYKIYKNLTATLEIAYVIEDFETYKEKGVLDNGRQKEYDNGWKAALYLGYKF